VYFLSGVTVEVNELILILFILRRCTEWIAELHISEREKAGDTAYALRFVGLQFFSLVFLIISSMVENDALVVPAFIVWSVVPVLQASQFIGRMINTKSHISKSSFLPHLGSSWAIGITTYTFRVLIVLLAGRTLGGMLISAYAIGGMFNAVYTYALGPSQALKENQGEAGNATRVLMGTVAFLVVLGLSLVGSVFLFEWISSNTRLFIQTIGFSLMGSGIMILAQRKRIYLLQALKVSVFVPDVLANILLVATVPFAFYLFGIEALTVLFLWSAVLAFLFYMSSSLFSVKSTAKNGAKMSISRDRSHFLQTIVLFLFLTPVFFQLSGGIFDSPVMIFDAKGVLKDLPLPLASVFCFIGIILLVSFERVRLSVTVIFTVFICMLLTTFISFKAVSSDYDIGKIILLMQYILPFFALVLGQSYQEPVNKVFRFEALFLYILVFILPFEIIATFIQGPLVMTPFLYIFSLYQHLQYLPVIFVGMYFLAATSLYSEVNLRFLLLFLAPVVGVYALMSASFAAIVLTVLGSIGLLIVLNKKARKFSILVSFFILMGMLSFSTLADNLLLKEELELSQSQSHKNVSDRLYYWKIYWDGVVETPTTFLFGHIHRPVRGLVPSAHNYYLGFIYNFGFISILSVLILIGYTLLLLYRQTREGMDINIVSLGVLLLFILLIDNFVKVGLRQPYPGMISFFLWGVLLNRLHNLERSKTEA
jgi:hypothetical protein